MSKIVLNTIGVSEVPSNNETAVAALKKASSAIFQPTDAQEKAKARFWTQFQPSPLQTESGISLTLALQVTKTPGLKTWWSDSGFVDWFLNRDTEREKFKFLFSKSLEDIERTIINNPDANPNAKVNVLKLLAEMNGYLQKARTDKFADEQINRMDEMQLKDYLERRGVRVVEEKIIDLPKS